MYSCQQQVYFEINLIGYRLVTQAHRENNCAYSSLDFNRNTLSISILNYILESGEWARDYCLAGTLGGLDSKVPQTE